VWIPDYPGFGKTTGELTENRLYELARLTYTLARGKYKQDSIIIYGKSLGTGIAAQLASKIKCRRLILETPYYSIPDLFSVYAPVYPTRSMSHFKIPTAEYLSSVTAPVTIFHGTEDGVIPYGRASRLRSVLKSGDEFITIEKGTHNNLNSFPLFHHVLDSLLVL
jgi:pimeloyl-ACP methyl ester carboxylesterase